MARIDISILVVKGNIVNRCGAHCQWRTPIDSLVPRSPLVEVRVMLRYLRAHAGRAPL